MAMNVERTNPTDAAWKAWSQKHADLLGNSLAPQRVLLEAAVRFVAAIAGHPIVTRMAAFFLLHTHLGLTPAQVGAAIGRTDRAMRTVQALSAGDFLDAIWSELGRHRKPKLLPEHAGPIAKYLVEHPNSTAEEVIGFIRSTFELSVDRQTLRRFSKAYNLGVLRGCSDEPEEDGERPFFLGVPASAGPSCSSPSRSG
jgi:hypothetical protein